MEKLICKSCGTIEIPRVEKTSIHLTAFCHSCGAYIKHLPKSTDDFTLYFGKFKGRNIKSMLDLKEERDYLTWLYSGTILKDSQKKIIALHLHV